jgi:tRNA pseudouridine55 synthase
MLGILGINKPVGITSRDALNHVSRQLKRIKVGHAGTLDPIASGVLVVCVGSATRLIEMVHAWPKEYIATFQLGQSSPSDDIETESTLLINAPIPSRSEIEAVLPRFLGEIAQVPPAFSAVKVNGQRAYHVARKGKAVELTARPVQIDELEIVDYQYPQLVLRIVCGTGTYIRSLGRDLAVTLDTAAVMSDLVRTRIGPITLEKCLIPGEITHSMIVQHIRSPDLVFTAIPAIRVDATELDRFLNGLPLPAAELQKRLDFTPISATKAWVISTAGDCAGLILQAEDQDWWPEIVFQEIQQKQAKKRDL